MPAVGPLLRRHALDALGALTAALYALPSLGYPFGIDQPLHWYIGRRWLDGELPYLSGISTKPPGAFAVHALSVWSMGDHQYAVRVVDVLFVLLAGLLIGTFRARRTSAEGVVDEVPRRPGEIGAACLAVAAITYTLFDWNALAHPDLWQGVFMAMTGWVIVRAPDGRVSLRRAFAAGAVAMIAVSFKHVACFTGVAFGAVIVGLELQRRRPLVALRGAAAFTGGVTTVLALLLLPFALGGGLSAFWEVMVESILRYANASREAVTTPRAWLTYPHGLVPTLVAFGIALGGVAIARARATGAEARVGLTVLLTMACALASVLVQGRSASAWFEYHWLALVPALALGVTFGVRQLAPRRGAMSFAIIVALAAAMFFAEPEWPSTPGHTYRREWASMLATERGESTQADRERVYVAENRVLGNYPNQKPIAHWIRSRARPGDTLCTDGFYGALHILTSLRCTNRFVVPPHTMEGALPHWEGEYVRALERSPPTFYVTTPSRARWIQTLLRQGYFQGDLGEDQRSGFVVLQRR